MRLAFFLIGMAASYQTEPPTFNGALCMSDIKMLDRGHGRILLSNADNFRVKLAVDDSKDVELIQFASVFGLTFCYDRGYVFLPNTVRELF